MRKAPAQLLCNSRGRPLESQFRRELELPRIQSGPRRSEERIRWTGDAVLVVLGNSSDKIRSPIHRVDFINVGPVEDVEAVNRQLQFVAFAGKIDGARKTKIPRTKMVAGVCVPPRSSYAVSHGVSVIVGVKAHELSEGAWRLHRDNAAEFKVAGE